MNPKDYRDEVEQRLAKQTVDADASMDPAVRSIQIIRGSAEGLAPSAIDSSAVPSDDEALDFAIETLSGSASRTAQLEAVKLIKFLVLSGPSTRARRPDYIAALRSALGASDAVVRAEVLGMLMREKDPVAQDRLVDGLQDPSKALVPPGKALSLLAYDVKAIPALFDLLTDIAQHHSSTDARVQALRLLGTDPRAESLLVATAKASAEPNSVQQAAVASLYAQAPELAKTVARELVLDDMQTEDVRATGLTLLEGHLADDELVSRVQRFDVESVSDSIKQSAKRFLGRQSR